MCLNRKDEVQAAKCLAKAVQADPGNLQIHQRFLQINTTTLLMLLTLFLRNADGVIY